MSPPIFTITITDPAGPRAYVPRPVFSSAVPLISAGVPQGSPPSVHLRLDCTGHPGAAAFLAARSLGPLHGSVQLWTHATGNGYVVLHVDSREDMTTAGPADEIDVVLDPVIHARVISDIGRTGRVMLTDRDDAGGWLIPVDVAAMRRVNAAALAHPRRVMLRMPLPGR